MRDHTKLRAFELADLCAVLIDYSLNNLSSYRKGKIMESMIG